MIPADREAIAISGHDPDREIGAGYLESSGKSRRAPVDGVKSGGVHVIRKAAGAADPGDHDYLFVGNPKRRERLLDGVENGVVAASGTPAHGLIRDEIFL